MIEIQVSLALHLTDGFTGKALKGAQVTLMLDGEIPACIVKEGGWFILTNLAHGAHVLFVQGNGFQREQIDFHVDDGAQERYLRLKPDASYRFGRRVTTLCAQFKDAKKKPLAGQTVYLLSDGAEQQMRVAQDDAAAGALALRLFTAQRASSLPIPGLFWLEDGENSEMTMLSGAGDGAVYSLEAPLKKVHKRGCVLRPMTPYCTDAQGQAFMVLPQSGCASLLVPHGRELRLHQVKLTPLAHTDAQITA